LTDQDIRLPHWDLSPFFSGPESPEFARGYGDLVRDVEALSALQETHGVRRRESAEVDAAFVAAFEQITGAWNALLDRQRLLSAYLGCLTTTDARDESARARMSELNTQSVDIDKLYTRYVAWVGTSDIDALAAQSQMAREHQYLLWKIREQARHQMPEGEEELATELRTSGLTGWSRLHGNMSALLEVKVALPDGEKSLPMSSVRALANDPDRQVRKAAFEAEVRCWESIAVPFAAALNGIKGFQQTVRRRRRYQDDVEPTLLANGINRAALNAMQQACVESLPDFHRYMSAKAKALGLPRLAWYDLTAPLGATVSRYSWKEAEAFIQENFGRFSERMAAFAAQTFEEAWTDAEPRVGKQGGAYCTGLRPGVSRIMMNYDGSFNSVSTLAHELGHAYHNMNLKDRTALQRGTPSTLAETASIFCETIAFEAAAAQVAPEERLALLDTVLERYLSVVVDIHSRFLLETGVFAKRQERDLTVPELNALMTDAQRQTYGVELEPLHPYMWAVKGHYYGPTFYNYPYTFGLLFGLGLYATYREDPASFKQQYDDLLSSTGMADAVTLCKRFGSDIEQPDFWRSSLDIIRGQIAEFEGMVGL
jgi:pepF/M3 family oligoendopeptidase